MMEKRRREPSRLAREIAESQSWRHHQSPPPEKKRRTSTSTTASTSKAKGKAKTSTSKTKASGKGKKEVKEQVAKVVDETGLEFNEEKGGYDANGTLLYCLCLGEDKTEDGKGIPMMQCEDCRLWYHLPCLGYSEEEAQAIPNYHCDRCIEAKEGVPLSTNFIETPSEASPSPKEDTESDGDYVETKPKGKISTHRKKRKPEGLEEDDDDEDDEDFDGGEISDQEVTSTKKRKRNEKASERRRTTTDHRRMSPERKQSVSQPLQHGVPPIGESKARLHVLENLKKSILQILPDASKAEEFATDLETELLMAHGELKNGVKQPGQAYKTRFSVLKKNLDTNEELKERVSLGELDPHAVANMSPEEMDAALRALKEKLYTQSLKVTVKEAMEQPKVKRTHKGEEVIDNFLESGPSTIPASAPADIDTLPATEGDDDMFVDSHFGELGPTAKRRNSSMSVLEEMNEVSMEPPELQSDLPTMMDTITEDPEVMTPVLEQIDEPPTPNDRPAFDINDVWGSVKSAPKQDKSKSGTDTPEYDPERKDEVESLREYGEDDLETILKDNQKTGTTTPPGEPPSAPSIVKLEDLPSIFKGRVTVPDEDSYPYVAYQVGGRHLGVPISVWQQLLPPNIVSSGRVPVQSGLDFFRACESPMGSKELFLVALQPDVQAMEESRSKSTNQKFESIIQYFKGRKRFGVCLTGPEEVGRKNVKEIYLVPLLPQEPLPKFVNLLEGEKLLAKLGKRTTPIMLGVIVTNRNVFHTQTRVDPTVGFDPVALQQLVTSLSIPEQQRQQANNPTLYPPPQNFQTSSNVGNPTFAQADLQNILNQFLIPQNKLTSDVSMGQSHGSYRSPPRDSYRDDDNDRRHGEGGGRRRDERDYRRDRSRDRDRDRDRYRDDRGGKRGRRGDGIPLDFPKGGDGGWARRRARN